MARYRVHDDAFGSAWPSNAQRLVEFGTHKGFWWLGAPNGRAFYADLDLVGMGCLVIEGGAGAVVEAATATGDGLMWRATSNSNSTTDAGHVGPQAAAANDWTMVWRGRIDTSTANMEVIIGARSDTAPASFDDANEVIGFRVIGTGTLVGVCDSAGAETTRDTSFTPDASELTLRIEVRSGGTIVRFYKDDVQVGADVTTNIPAGVLNFSCGIGNGATSELTTMYTADWGGWREV